MSAAQPFEARLIALELLITHLEREHEAMNATLLEHERTIAELKRHIERLENRVAAVAEEAPARNPAEERPPHY